jgi:hypothetical protein
MDAAPKGSNSRNDLCHFVRKKPHLLGSSYAKILHDIIRDPKPPGDVNLPPQRVIQ